MKKFNYNTFYHGAQQITILIAPFKLQVDSFQKLTHFKASRIQLHHFQNSCSHLFSDFSIFIFGIPSKKRKKGFISEIPGARGESKDPKIILGREEDMTFLKFKIIESYNGDDNAILKGVKIRNIDGLHYLAYNKVNNEEKVFFASTTESLQRIWIMKSIKEDKKEAETKENEIKTKENEIKIKENGTKTKENGTKTKENGIKTKENKTKTKENKTKTKENKTKEKEKEIKATFRLSTSGKYLSVTGDSLILSEKPKIFTLKYLINESMANSAFKLYPDSVSKSLRMVKNSNSSKNSEEDEKSKSKDKIDNSDILEAKLEKNKRRITSNIFEYEIISESNRLICSFYVDFLNAIKKMGEKYADSEITNIIEAVKEMRCFVKNTSGRAMDSTYKIGFPVEDRLKLLNSVKLDEYFTELLSNINEILPITLVSEKNMFIKKITKLLSLLPLNDGIILPKILEKMDKFDPQVKLNICIYIFTKILSKNDIKSGKLLKKKIQSLPKILPSLFNIKIMKVLQKMILWREEYDEVAQMLIFNLLYKDQETLNIDFQKLSVNAEGQLQFEGGNQKQVSEKTISQEMILLASIAYGNNATGLNLLNNNFALHNIFEVFEKKIISLQYYPGLLRILNYGYINFEQHSKHICSKSYDISNISTQFPPTESISLIYIVL